MKIQIFVCLFAIASMNAEVFSEIMAGSFFELPGLGQVYESPQAPWAQVPCTTPPCKNTKKVI